jgi:hypothetical protein
MGCRVNSELVRSARDADTQLTTKIAASKATLAALEERTVVAAATTVAAIGYLDFSNKELAAAVITCRFSGMNARANVFDRRPKLDARES